MLALNLMFFMNDQISQFINCHAPCRKLSKHEIKLSTKAWITKDILAKIRYRHKLYSQIMKSKQPDPNLIYLHKKFRKSVVKDIELMILSSVTFFQINLNYQKLCQLQ